MMNLKGLCRGFSAKAETQGERPPLAEASGNIENRDNMGVVVINGFTDAAVKCWSHSESNPDYVLSRATLIFSSDMLNIQHVTS